MAEPIAIKEEKKVKIRPMMYRNTKSIEDDEKEIQELEAQITEEADAEHELKQSKLFKNTMRT